MKNLTLGFIPPDEKSLPQEKPKDGFSGKELRAIRRFAKDNGLRLALSNRPIVNFLGPDGLVREHIKDVVSEYDVKQKEDTRARQADRKKHETPNR